MKNIIGSPANSSKLELGFFFTVLQSPPDKNKNIVYAQLVTSLWTFGPVKNEGFIYDYESKTPIFVFL